MLAHHSNFKLERCCTQIASYESNISKPIIHFSILCPLIFIDLPSIFHWCPLIFLHLSRQFPSICSFSTQILSLSAPSNFKSRMSTIFQWNSFIFHQISMYFLSFWFHFPWFCIHFWNKMPIRFPWKSNEFNTKPSKPTLTHQKKQTHFHRATHKKAAHRFFHEFQSFWIDF